MVEKDFGGLVVAKASRKRKKITNIVPISCTKGFTIAPKVITQI